LPKLVACYGHGSKTFPDIWLVVRALERSYPERGMGSKDSLAAGFVFTGRKGI